MPTWADVRRCALDLPETVEQTTRGNLGWRVNGKAFAWERPLRRADLEFLGGSAPTGPVLGVRVADKGVKHAVIAGSPHACFTTPHFDGYAAVLIRLDDIEVGELQELIIESWLVQAPKRLSARYLAR